MSIFFDFNIGPKGRRLRRAVQEDKYEIEALLKHNESGKLFGEVDVGSLIELTTLSICMVNSKQEVIGFMSVCDHPSIPGVDPAAWETWMRNMYQKYYLSRNTLFIHAMCCAETAFAYFLEESLVSLFKNDVYLQQIVLMVPPDCPKEFILKYQTIRKYNYKRNKAKRVDDYEANYHYFYTAIRQDFCPKLRIRRAVEEDNDDIVAILDKNSPRLRELYGDYYISEIIGQHPEMKRKIIVTEGIDGVSGVMCLNSDVNFSMLQNTYELDSYHGLCKATPLEKEKNRRSNILLRTFGDPIMLGKWTPFDVTPFIEHENTQDDQSYDNVSLKTKPTNKVNFRRQSTYNIDLHNSEDLSDRLSPILSQCTSFVDFLLEEDPFDYDIVNIDCNLLTVPRVSKDVCLPIVKKRSPRRSVVSEMENKYRRRSSLRINKKTENKNKFSGEPNAFMIELFGLHHDIDESRLRVRRAEIIDIPQIAELLYSLDGKETLWSVENTIFRRNELEAYVFLSNVSVVGIGILQPPDQIDFLRSKFNLDEYRTHMHHVMGQDQGAGCATLNTALVYPAFEPHYRFFVRDMLRLSGIHSLVWMTAYRNKWVTHKINSFASVMIPLRPRISHLDYAPVPKLNKLQALSNFFDTSSYIFFTNLTLISPHGLPYVRNSNPLAEMMFLKDHTNSEKYLKSVPYTYYVNTIHGTVVEIHKSDIKYSRLDVPHGLKEPTISSLPFNVFIVNNVSDANKAINYLKSIDWENTEAVHMAGMGYSGGLLVDQQFMSSAPLVYAAGPLAQHRYSYHDSYEIGFYLGKLIRNELDPLFTEQSNYGTDKENVDVNQSCNGYGVEDDTQQESGQSTPELKRPIVQYCYLPGGLQYLEVRPPGIKVPHHYVQTLEYNGFVIETFKKGYFKLHFNKDLIVDGITCLTPEKFSLENFKKLYGLSSSILSNVHLRYTTKRIDNLFEFFREPWAHFLYHDHVEELFAIVKELLPTGQPHGETIKEVLTAAVDKLPITAHSYNMKMKIRSSFEKSPHIEAITQYVIQWVSENNVLLPMYLQPSERTAYAHDLDKHPAFKRRKRSVVRMLAKIC
ncbi:unnamed protein product [Pieris brassicae]|uniref:Cilia- and flagella-associated protein 61 N-terminal domain-containing protein n=1 Tax=Pieris brassicae TaxID=7116 RepID=A0A9P0TTU9_PIEBR|nr:unnamed protein product [Pieris brassicae]